MLREDIDIQISQCAANWDSTDPEQRDNLFGTNFVYESQFMVDKEDLVGHDKLIYKVDGQYYKEKEAWAKILTSTMFGNTDSIPKTPSSPQRKRASSVFKSTSETDKPIKSFRPSSSTLALLDLKLGENDLTYEYMVAEDVAGTISVRIFLYKSTDKIVVSDIDGTITK